MGLRRLQLENLPTAATTERDDLLCNSHGECLDGRRPSEPRAAFRTTLCATGFIGLSWTPIRHAALRAIVMPVSGPADGPRQWLVSSLIAEVPL